jgi:hypothetical protein
MAGPLINKTSNSPTKSSYDAAWIEKATVMDVDIRNWTVDVVTEYSSKVWEKLQVATPYFHTNNGEGIFAMPEPGSICLVVQPSDDQTPYVLAFLGSFELEHAKTANLEDRAGEAAVETEELQDELSSSKSTISSGAGQSSVSASARGGRPFLNPGDIMIRTRDKNFLVLRRGGVVQIGSTPTCQSIYIPINNFLRQFAENYEISTPGGLLFWNVERLENDPGGEANIMYRLSLRDKAQNEKGDVQIKIGHVDDDIRYELQVAPQGVEIQDGLVSNSKLRIAIDKNGNQQFIMSGSLEFYIDQNRKTVIKGTDDIEVTGARTISALSQSTSLKDYHELKAATSSENISGIKTIKAAKTMIGDSPVPAVIGPALIAWCASHTHPCNSAPPSTAPALENTLSKKVFIT